MPIYRGPGGAGDATSDASSEVLLAVIAKDAAIAAQTAAEAAQAAAETAQTAAELAETNAETAETNAETAATNASTSADEAAASAASIVGDVADAETARAGAEAAQLAAETAQTAAELAETNAETAQTAAASSASAASTSASNAATSATNASNSATAAASSASSASSSASTATTKASEASTSATNAASSATAASTSATNAASSASTASTKASEASSSASAASTSASNASTSASNAATSATNAASSATAAASAQTAAEAARDATLTAYDNFDDRYLGSKTSDPALDNDGNALVAGALYFNSSDGAMKVYTGSAWVAAYVSGGSYLNASNNLSDVASVSSARTNLGLGTAATTDATAYATAAQGTKADTAYGWGNHASAGYAPVARALPAGGTTAQVLAKNSNTDYDSEWIDIVANPSLDELSDVVITDVAENDVLTFDGTQWVNAAPSGGGGGGAQADIFYENAKTIATSYTITTDKNAMSAGPLTLSSGSVTVTVNAGSTWTVI